MKSPTLALVVVMTAVLCSGEPPVGGYQQQGGRDGGGFQQYGSPQQQQQQQYSPPPQQSQPQQYGAPQPQGQQQQSQQYGTPQQQQQQQQEPQKISYGPPGYTPGSPLGNTGESCPPNDREFNKQLVLKAYQEAIGDHNVANIRQYFAEDYIQHNPMVPDGLDGFIAFVSSIPDPPMKVDFKRVAADGDLVFIHSRLPIFGTTFAAVDIFRIQCGKIQEHWDVLQDTNLKMPAMNSHPFF